MHNQLTIEEHIDISNISNITPKKKGNLGLFLGRILFVLTVSFIIVISFITIFFKFGYIYNIQGNKNIDFHSIEKTKTFINELFNLKNDNVNIKSDIEDITTKFGMKESNVNKLKEDSFFYGAKINSNQNGTNGLYNSSLDSLFVYDIYDKDGKVIPYNKNSKEYQEVIVHEFTHYLNSYDDISNNSYGLLKEMIKETDYVQTCGVNHVCIDIAGLDKGNSLLKIISSVVKNYSDSDLTGFLKRVSTGDYSNDKDIKNLIADTNVLNEVSAYIMSMEEVRNDVKTLPHGEAFISIYMDIK